MMVTKDNSMDLFQIFFDYFATDNQSTFIENVTRQIFIEIGDISGGVEVVLSICN